MNQDRLRTLPLSRLVTAGLALSLLAGCGGCDDEKTPATPGNNAVNNNTVNNASNNNTNNNPNNNACTPGSEGCACDNGGCGAGLVCEADRCVAGGGEGQVSDPAARSCEVLLRESGATIQRATFGEGVTGQLRRQAPNVALAFMRNADAPFEGQAVTLQVDGPADGFAVRSVTCFDRSGAPLPNVEVSF